MDILKSILSWPKRFLTEKVIKGLFRSIFKKLPGLKWLDGWKTEITFVLWLLVKLVAVGVCCGSATPYVEAGLNEIIHILGVNLATLEDVTLTAFVLSLFDHFAKDKEG